MLIAGLRQRHQKCGWDRNSSNSVQALFSRAKLKMARLAKSSFDHIFIVRKKMAKNPTVSKAVTAKALNYFTKKKYRRFKVISNTQFLLFWGLTT